MPAPGSIDGDPASGIAARPRRLLLAGVRHHRGAPAVLRRARGARRRPPQGVVRSRHPARRCRPALRRGLLPPAAERRRLAGGDQPAHRSAGARRAADRDPGDGRSRRCRGPGAGVARRRRLHPALPARHERARQSARGDRGHQPAVRRRRAAPAPPGDRPRHRRRAGPASARTGAPGVPHQRGPRRIPRPRTGPGMDRTGPVVRRGDRGGTRRRTVHHPHARAGRHRPVPPRPVRAVLRHVRQGMRGHVRGALRAGPARRRAGRQVQHGGDGPAPRRPLERCRQAPRRRVETDVRRDVAGAAPRRTPRSVTSPTACTPARGSATGSINC